MIWWIVGYYAGAGLTLAWIARHLRADKPVSGLAVMIPSLIWPVFWSAQAKRHAIRMMRGSREAVSEA